jgi:formylglycine-generating enzyme required for sulfatase activity
MLKKAINISIFLLTLSCICNTAVAQADDERRNGAVINIDGIELVYVEGMGSDSTAIQSFYIGKFVVTQAQWRAVMGNNPSTFRGANLPVEMVNWDEIHEFLSQLNARTGRNFRLPTEAEWEFAARGGTAESFCPGGCKYSGSNNLHDVGWFSKNSKHHTQPVGAKQANELGIYDMSGNVREWCLITKDSGRVLRGGSWNLPASLCDLSFRFDFVPTSRSCVNGFRVILPCL